MNKTAVLSEIVEDFIQSGQGKLSLCNLDLHNFPEEILRIGNIDTLDLRYNKIHSLPDNINELNNIKNIYLNHNFIEKIPSSIGQLKNLTFLGLSHNNLKELPIEIGNLQNLEELDISYNKFLTIPVEIGKLKKLSQLLLQDNDLRSIPIELGKLKKLTGLYLRGNVNLNLGPEMSQRLADSNRILSYIRERYLSGEQPLNEVKILFVGEPRVGKSSIIERLVNQNYNPKKRTTDGIEINKWEIEVEKDKIRANLWDFGGQEIMHHTHKFFLTARSLYILVINARDNENQNRINYWLDIIDSVSNRAPVIIVSNWIDQHRQHEIDERGLRQRYPFIRSFIQTSCEENEGFDNLYESIKEIVKDIPYVRNPEPQTFMRVKSNLEEINDDYISFTDFSKICDSENVNSLERQKYLSELLHELGCALNFNDSLELKDTHILNPEWVTTGIYKILLWPDLKTSHHGIFKESDLISLLPEGRYPDDKHHFLIAMMEKFEICFMLHDTQENTYLVPQLLSIIEPDTGQWEDSLTYEYHYESILPPSIMSRFIVRMHQHVSDRTWWRSGCVLIDRKKDNRATINSVKKYSNRALVKADENSKIITIQIDGPRESRREFLRMIQNEFDSIHNTFAGFSDGEKVKEKLRIPGYPKVSPISVQYLKDLESLKETTFYPEGTKTPMQVKQLLDMIQDQNRQVADITDGEDDDEYNTEIPDDTVNILHLSDLHFTENTDENFKFRCLIDDLTKNQDFFEVNLIIISGDFANKCNHIGFEKARIFIEMLLDKYKLTKDKCILVPGNHDLEDIEDTYTLTKSITGIPENEIIKKDNIYLKLNKEIYPKRLKTFSEKIYQRIKKEDYPEDVCLQGMSTLFLEYKLQILAFNSCHEIDEHNRKRSSIFPGSINNAVSKADDQLNDAIDKNILKKNENIIRIAVFHHAINGPEQIRDTNFLSLFQTNSISIILHGDIHELKRELVGNYQRDRIQIIGSGSFDSDSTGRPESIPRHYNIIQIKPSKNKVRVITRAQLNYGSSWDGWFIWPDKQNLRSRVDYYEFDLVQEKN